MATQHKTPGVYVEEVSTLAPSVVGVATAIPAFVGFTACKSTEAEPVPVKVTSLLDYEKEFGKGPKLFVNESGVIKNAGYVMYDSIRLYYENGGGICYIVSVGKIPASVTDTVTLGADPYKAGIQALEKVDEVTLVACPDAALLLDDVQLSSVQQAMLKHCSDMKDRFAILDVKVKDDDQKDGVTTFRNKLGVNGLSYGAAYYPLLKSSYLVDVPFDTVIDYLSTLDGYKEDLDTAKSLFTLGGSFDAAITEAMKALEAAKGNEMTDPSVLEACTKALAEAEEDKTKAEEERLYAIKCIKANLSGYAEAVARFQDEASVITPSGAVCGAIVAMDNNIGVWQAPANVSLSSIKDVCVNLTGRQQEDLNVHESGKSINAIRTFTGKGILIWGARTLDGNDNEWRYIPVRRLFNYVEESVQKSTFWAVFQPNDANTWIKIQCQISNFLTGLWSAGALAGATPEEAFYVNVGLGVTMDEQDILNGNLIVQIGIAAVRPAEFIELKFSHKVQQ